MVEVPYGGGTYVGCENGPTTLILSGQGGGHAQQHFCMGELYKGMSYAGGTYVIHTTPLLIISPSS